MRTQLQIHVFIIQELGSSYIISCRICKITGMFNIIKSSGGFFGVEGCAFVCWLVFVFVSVWFGFFSQEVR